MTTGRFDRLRELLTSALQLPEDDRESYIARECASSPALGEAALKLLRYDAGPNELERPTPGVSVDLSGEPSPAPAQLGRYRVIGKLGAGGMGVVYLGEDETLGRQVAIKALSWLAGDEKDALQRLRKEARILARFNHPNIATLYSLEEADSGIFLTMEVIEGTSLTDRFQDGPINIPETLRIARQLAAAIDAAHSRDIVHRDLKPSNVMLNRDGVVKVLDFGLAGPLSADFKRENRMAGTPGYMSPEQIRGAPTDHRTDIWSFGCILYECLTGRPAFPGETVYERVAATLHLSPAWSALPPDLPADLRDLLRACLHRDPAQRPWRLAEAIPLLERDSPAPRAHAGKATWDRFQRARGISAPITTFIGRETDLAALRRQFDASRLVSLIGPGGCGKTRLAAEAAASWAGDFKDGVWMVELAPLASPELAASAVAAGLGLRETMKRPSANVLIDFLRDKELLLLLDNCEHLLSACGRLAASLLAGSPRLRILATSRQALGVMGEATYRLQPLAIPELDSRTSLDLLERNESIQLFMDRARAVRPGFTMNDANRAALVSICRRLDGIPLALELAASRMRTMAEQEIATRLDDRFRFLATSGATSPERHQTLEASIEWSYKSLDSEQQALFRQLSVFVGGWTLESAHNVCSAQVTEWEFLERLGSLVECSLVEMSRQGMGGTERPRYHMLETLRQFAGERLEEAGEGRALRLRHRDHFMVLAEAAVPHYTGKEQSSWMKRLTMEHDNLRAAAEACVADPAETWPGLRIAGALGRYWWVGGHWSEGRRFFGELLARPVSIEAAPARADTLNWEGNLARAQGDYERAREAHLECLTVRRDLGDAPGVHASLCNLGVVSANLGDHRSALAYYEESLQGARDLGDDVIVARVMTNLGVLHAGLGEFAKAEECLSEALAIWRRTGHRYGVAAVLNNIGAMAQRRGDSARAWTAFEEGLTVLRELGDVSAASYALLGLGEAAWGLKDTSAAVRFFGEGLEGCRRSGERPVFVTSLETWSTFAAPAQPRMAVQMMAVTDRLRTEIHFPASPYDRSQLDARLRRLRERLGDDEFSSEWNAGLARTPEEAIQVAHALLPEILEAADE